MFADAYAQQIGLALVQLAGFIGLCMARLSLRGRHRMWLQAGYFCALFFVAGVLCWGVQTCSHWWFITGATFALMIVGPIFHSAEERSRNLSFDEYRSVTSDGRYS